MIAEAILASLLATTATHIDMGELFGSYVLHECIERWAIPPHIKQDKIDETLEGMFSTLKKAETSTLYVSFGQLTDAANLHASVGGRPTDTVAAIFSRGMFHPRYTVGKTDENFLTYFNQYAKKKRTKLSISFGGPEATSMDMILTKDTANTLKKFMKEYNFSSTDLVLEGKGLAGFLSHNTMPQITKFVKNMGDISLTLGKNLKDGPKGPLAPLFTNFTNRFSKLNLMLFDDTKFFIKPFHPEWGIKAWSKHVPFHKICIGFSDQIDYSDPGACGGSPYQLPPGLTSGQAAAHIYRKTQRALQKKLGEPVFWVEKPSELEHNQFVRDFHNYLKKAQI